jgi:hypothetical protein
MDSAVLSAAKLPPQQSSAVSKQTLERVFFDPGAQMSCISPHIAAKYACVERSSVNVEIIQMGKDDLKVLADMLGDKTFFFGDEPTQVRIFTSNGWNERRNR